MISFSKSWVEVSDDSHFSLANIPFGVFTLTSSGSEKRIGTRIGDYVVDLKVLVINDFFAALPFPVNVLTHDTLNSFMSLERNAWHHTRQRIISLLAIDGDTTLKDNQELCHKVLINISDVVMHLPCIIGNYTDFYSSRQHAVNVGTMFRGPENALQPNWLHMPIAYHGRASSVVCSGTPVTRPYGQMQFDATVPSKGSKFQPSSQLDFELEIAFLVGGESNELGCPISMARAEERIFGVVLMNDWSARDIQVLSFSLILSNSLSHYFSLSLSLILSLSQRPGNMSL